MICVCVCVCVWCVCECVLCTCVCVYVCVFMCMCVCNLLLYSKIFFNQPAISFSNFNFLKTTEVFPAHNYVPSSSLKSALFLPRAY